MLKGEQELSSIPERRLPQEESQRQKQQKKAPAEVLGADIARVAFKLSVPVWRCTVCGYLCGREGPPEVCPICKVGKERFERFI